MPASYGHRNVSHSVTYPGTPWADLAIAYSSADDVYEDITSFLELRAVARHLVPGGGRFAAASPPTVLEHSVTKISSDGVFQGSSSLS